MESPIEIVSVIKCDFFVNTSTILWSNEGNVFAVGCVTNTSMSELAVAPKMKINFNYSIIKRKWNLTSSITADNFCF